MPRQGRRLQGGQIYHVHNRAVRDVLLFSHDDEFREFEALMAAAERRHPLRILAYCLLPDHWHMVLWPETGRDMSSFLRLLTHNHTMKWHADHRSLGSGRIYRDRYKAFPVQMGRPLLNVLRLVESHAVRSSLAEQAEDWPWSSLHRPTADDDQTTPRLAPWPTDRPDDWAIRLNTPPTREDLHALRVSLARGAPYGERQWQWDVAATLNLEHTLRPRGRPPKHGHSAVAPSATTR